MRYDKVMVAAWNDRDDGGEEDGSLVDVEREHVGTIASSTTGALHVTASSGEVTLTRNGEEVLGMSPALARGLAELLERAADMVEAFCTAAHGERPSCTCPGHARRDP